MVARGYSNVPRLGLFHKYFAVMFLAVMLPLLANGATEAWLGYRDQRVMIDAGLRLQALAAARDIRGFLASIESQLGWMTHWSGEANANEQRRVDALRLLRQVPAITEVAHFDASGREQLRVSRLAMDQIGSGEDRSSDPVFTETVKAKVYVGNVYFRKESEPYVTIALAGARKSAGVIVAEVNLKFIWDVVSQIRVGNAGVAYVIDTDGRLIAHPDITRVLAGTVDENAQLFGQMLDQEGKAVLVKDAQTGANHIAAAAMVDIAGWRVVAEQPLSEAFGPIYTALWRTLVLMVLGAILAGSLAYWLARRMTGPIHVLESGVERIGAGHLEHRIALTTGDELERLGTRINEMAKGLSLSRERGERIERLKRFLAPQVAELIESAGKLSVLESQEAEIVVVFCDLRNFTTFAQSATPQEIMGVLREYYSALGPIINRFEATQTGFAGDGAMIVLNAPVQIAKPTQRAIAMAIEMQSTVQTLIRAWRAKGYDIGFGMGLAKGWATVGQIGYENRVEYTAIGNLVNLASRLCASATDGEILVDATAAADVRNRGLVKDLGPYPLKGYADRIPVFSVVYAKGGS